MFVDVSAADISENMSKRIRMIALSVAMVLTGWAVWRTRAGSAGANPADRAGSGRVVAPRAFMETYCVSCHDSTTRKGGLDLTRLGADYGDRATFDRWVRVHDRVWDEEMPPKGAPQPGVEERSAFIGSIAAPLLQADRRRIEQEGRAVWRRMNREEYENTLRDLLDAPWLQIRDLLPEDGLAHRSNKVGTVLDVSHVQINRYLSAAEQALREVIVRSAERPETVTKRYYAREQRSFTGHVEFSQFNRSSERATFPLIGNEADVAVLRQKAPMTVGASDPAKRELESMGVVASSYEPLEIRFNQFKAPIPGRYRLRLSAHSFWAGPQEGEKWWHPSREVASAGRTVEPVTLYAEIPPRQMRLLGTFDVEPEPTVKEMEVFLLKDETIRPDAVRLFRSRPPNWRNPLAEKDGQPGVAFRWLEVVGPLGDEWPGRGHRLLFGDLPIQKSPNGSITVVPTDARRDAERLLRNFMARAYRRPDAVLNAVSEGDLQRFVGLVEATMRNGGSFVDGMITGYAAVLCSPAFVTLEERPGRLDDHALATRLSYFLWNSAPDEGLRELARQGALHRPAVLQARVEEMLRDTKSERFVTAFLDYWLDLRKVNNTSPDELLYCDYYLDDYLVESAAAETYGFFGELLRRNLPARNLIASDFVMINERLANHYGISGVRGSEIRRVALPGDSVRGGLLTQASVLKVTANGTTTSPVVRGAWVMERILGKPAPPPPPSIPAVEPDTRGATTIREQLEKHRTLPSCNACHAKIDPAGFALENFDVFGAWRDKYRALAEGEKAPGIGKNGQRFTFRYLQPIDASGILPDGRRFQDIRGLKRLLVSDERQIARNLVVRMVIFATGAPVQFSDRPKIEAILDNAAKDGFGVRSLIHNTIASDIFRRK